MLSYIKTWLASVIACLAFVVQVGVAQDAYDLVDAGSELSEPQAQALETKLKNQPDDVATRTQLLGYYWWDRIREVDARQRHADHVLYLIEHTPTSEVLGLPHGTLEPHFVPRAYTDGSRLWEGHLKAEVVDVAVLRNAANYWGRHETVNATKALERAMEKEPESPEWPESLGHLIALELISAREDAKPTIAAKALTYYERAYELSDALSRSYLLPELADLALAAERPDQARGFAQQMLADPQNPDDWNAGNNFHTAHQVLGTIALAEGDVDAAAEHLIESGRTPGSPQLNSFGPQTRLAAQLLEAGQDQAVIEYLDRCREFWEMGQEDLAEWKKSIRAGDEPGWDRQMVY